MRCIRKISYIIMRLTETSKTKDSIFSTIDYSKPTIFNDIPFDVLEQPQSIKALQNTLMVPSGPRSIDASSNHD